MSKTALQLFAQFGRVCSGGRPELLTPRGKKSEYRSESASPIGEMGSPWCWPIGQSREYSRGISAVLAEWHFTNVNKLLKTLAPSLVSYKTTGQNLLSKTAPVACILPSLFVEKQWGFLGIHFSFVYTMQQWHFWYVYKCQPVSTDLVSFRLLM